MCSPCLLVLVLYTCLKISLHLGNADKCVCCWDPRSESTPRKSCGHVRPIIFGVQFVRNVDVRHCPNKSIHRWAKASVCRVFRVSGRAVICSNEVKRLRSGGNNWYKIFNLVDKAPCNALQQSFWKLVLTLTVLRWLCGCRHICLDLFIESA